MLAASLLVAGIGAAPASASPQATRIAALVDHMTTKQKIGQMMMVSFAGTAVNSQVAQMLKTIQPGGVTLFGDNFSTPSQLKALDQSLQRNSHIPMFISVDQEGGEVIRITSGVKQLPSEQQYGYENNPAQVKADTSIEGTQLHKLGINMNLAPVLDVATPTSIIGSETRSYGPNASRDSALGLAAIQGYQSHGIAATAKHVLGLGTTTTNPETQLPYISLSAKQLTQQLLPFKTASKGGVDAMMVTHVILAGITSPTTPASLSYKVVAGILRNQLNFKGVIMTDSLTMGAVTARFGIGQASTMAIGAGEDILLIATGGATATNVYSKAMNAVLAKVQSGKISVSRLNQSVARILQLKAKLHLPLPTSPSHPVTLRTGSKSPRW